MRILYLNHNLAGRGTYFRCLHFARQVAAAGHDVTLITTATRARARWHEETLHGVRVWTTPRLCAPRRHDGGYAPLDIAARALHACGSVYDIVHAFDHRPNVSIPGAIYRRRGRGKVVADWADWWTRGGITTDRRRWRWIDTWEARLEEGQKRAAHAVTVTSTALYDRALALGLPASRLLLLPSGADIDAIPVLDRDACREALGLSLQDQIIAMAGFSLWDLDHLLDALRVALEHAPLARLLVCGLEKEGGVEPAVAGRGLTERVTLAGAVPYDQLPQWLGAADVQVLPLRDTLANRARGPIKFGDYLASGRPVVTQRVGDCAALVEQHNLGLVADPDAASLGQALATLLQDSEGRATMGRNARAFAEQEWSWARLAQPLLALYEQLAGER